MRITELLAQDHRAVYGMFLEFERLPLADAGGRRVLFDRIVEELELHARAEEETVYPAVRAVSRRVDDAEAGHAHLRTVIGQVQRVDAGADEFPTLVGLVKRIVLAHVMEEESGMFLDAGRMDAAELERLAAAFHQQKEALKQTRTKRVA